MVKKRFTEFGNGEKVLSLFEFELFISETGEELAKFRLPTGGHATPMTYTNKDSRQFVVIAAGGHWAVGSPASDHLIAYALPEK